MTDATINVQVKQILADKIASNNPERENEDITDHTTPVFGASLPNHDGYLLPAKLGVCTGYSRWLSPMCKLQPFHFAIFIFYDATSLTI